VLQKKKKKPEKKIEFAIRWEARDCKLKKNPTSHDKEASCPSWKVTKSTARKLLFFRVALLARDQKDCLFKGVFDKYIFFCKGSFLSSERDHSRLLVLDLFRLVPLLPLNYSLLQSSFTIFWRVLGSNWYSLTAAATITNGDRSRVPYG